MTLRSPQYILMPPNAPDSHTASDGPSIPEVSITTRGELNSCAEKLKFLISELVFWNITERL